MQQRHDGATLDKEIYLALRGLTIMMCWIKKTMEQGYLEINNSNNNNTESAPQTYTLYNA